MAHTLKNISLQVLKNNNVEAMAKTMVRAKSSVWEKVIAGPPDAILGINEKFKKDKEAIKVNLGVGAYRDDNGKPFILPSVIKAKELIYCANLDHEYAPISGEAGFTDAVAKLGFGEDSPVILNKLNCTVQSLSGTGALRVGMDFINNFHKVREIWFPNPTWGNHLQISSHVGLPFKRYRYYDPKTNGFDLEGAVEDICQIPEGAAILLHACAHNPTGVDPKIEEWKALSEVIKTRKLLPFFDMAYQGFATGNIDNDAAAVRLFVEDGHQVVLAQSFAKNMGLYGERAGALSLLCIDPDEVSRVMSQVKILIRSMYSNPPRYGAHIVKTILTTPALKDMWLRDVKQMADRIISMRHKLRESIEGMGNKQKWNHITDQIGMFCYTGLNPDQVARLTKEFHVYLTKDGRISVAGITSKNVEHVARGIHKVTSS